MNNKIIIEDYREFKDFKGCTFNNIKNTEVKKELIKCLTENNYDKSLYWMSEIMCSCNYILLWEIFFYIMTNIVNISNLKLIIFLNKKYDIFKDIINNCKNENEVINLRNNNNIRFLFCDIVILICNSDKNYMLDYKKINVKDFSFEKMNNFLKAPNVNYVNSFFKDNDPKELYIILNEFIYNLEEKNNIECYKWIYIYINYYLLCKKNNNILLCELREELDLDSYSKNLKHHPIWIIWSILMNKSKKYNLVNNYVKLLLNFFKVQLTYGKIKSRLNILFFCITIYIQKDSREIFDKPIVKNKERFMELDNIARNSINNILKKIIQNYKKNPENIKQTKNKNSKVLMSFEKLKLLDNFMLNKNNDNN
ncbi:hypothetical protein CL656_02780 [bacterium]|nr:hypothetical protein [bacterium]